MRYASSLLLLSLLTSGCYSTIYVNLPATMVTPLPPRGDLLSVQVKDVRHDLSAAQVGFKRDAYGAKRGTVELAGNEAIADRLTRDIISVLREKGYRAQRIKDLQSGSADILVGVEVASFLLDDKIDFFTRNLQGFAVLRLRMTKANGGRVLWEDVVRAEYEKPGIAVLVGSDHQEVVEKLYRILIVKVREGIPPKLP